MRNLVKFRIVDAIKAKKKGAKLSMITAYDYSTAKFVDEAGADMILVGDSAAMVMLGYDTTVPITVDEMLIFCKAVSRAAKHALVVGDMPFLSYHISNEQAVLNAGRLIKEGNVDCVKVEGGKEVVDKVKAIVSAGIPVMGHIGLTPQTDVLSSGYKYKGMYAEDALNLIKDAELLQEAGAFAVVLECVTSEVAKIITERLTIPTIGIGSGRYCDGQVLVIHDVLGIYEEIRPKFAKRYAELGREIRKAISNYVKEIKSSVFPGEEHSTHMSKEEISKLMSLLKGG